MFFDDTDLRFYLSGLDPRPKGVAPLRHELTRARLLGERRERAGWRGIGGLRFR